MINKNVLIYATGFQGHQEMGLLEEAIYYSNIGCNVHYINCDKAIGVCNHNLISSKLYCSICNRIQKCNNKKYLQSNIIQYNISDIISESNICNSKSISFQFDDIKSIKSIKYKGIEIGYGAVSTYISSTRNINPEFNPEFISFIDKLLKKQVLLIESIGNFIHANNIDLLIVHNGRFAQYKPIVGLAKINNIEYVSTEGKIFKNEIILKNNFHNSIPHDIDARVELIENLWNNNQLNLNEKIEIGNSFFIKRRNSEWAGDRIYTKNQTKDLLPTNWDSQKENIVIFNSSEDEYISINEVFDNSTLFKTQIKGIKTILDHYVDDNTKHFYLRIHPNLNLVKYNYHLNLYKLNYPNLTVIGSDSKINSYSLLDASSKVIVFNSTIGIESAYWKKPVITLSLTEYHKFGLAYKPNSLNELWILIDDINLKPLFNDNVYKFGFYFMTDNYPRYEHIPDKIKIIKFFNHEIVLYDSYRIVGSKLLYYFFYTFIPQLINKFGLIFPIRRIPKIENK